MTLKKDNFQVYAWVTLPIKYTVLLRVKFWENKNITGGGIVVVEVGCSVI